MKTKGKIAATLTAALTVVALSACADKKTEDPVILPQPSTSASAEVSPPPTLPDGSAPATQETVEPTFPEGVTAPKGQPETSEGVTNSTVAYTKSEKRAGLEYFYAATNQAVVTKGVYADVQIAKPYLDSTDFHTLHEIAISNDATTSGKRNIVEVGWTVDKLVNNNSDEPHLFVFYWVNGVAQCYNGCGFVQYGGSTARAGMQLTPGSIKKMGIQYFNNNWWISYDNKWVGYYPGTLWSAATPTAQTFTESNSSQLFGEVAANSSTPCTDMGTGYHGFGSSIPVTNKAKVNNTRYVGTTTPVDLFFNSPTNSTYYTIAKNGSERSYTYGGPGAGGNIGSC